MIMQQGASSGYLTYNPSYYVPMILEPYVGLSKALGLGLRALGFGWS